METNENSIAALGIGVTPLVLSQFAISDVYKDMNASRIRNFNRGIGVPYVVTGASNIDKLQKAMGTNENIYYDTKLSGSVGPAFLQEDYNQYGYKKGVHLPYTNINKSNIGIVAHELGHAKDYSYLKNPTVLNKSIKGLMRISRSSFIPGTIAGSLVAAAAPDENVAKSSVITSAAMAAPLLADEASATIRGVRGLSKVYGGLGKALTQGGLKSIKTTSLGYLPVAAVPSITYIARKMLEKKDKK